MYKQKVDAMKIYFTIILLIISVTISFGQGVTPLPDLKVDTNSKIENIPNLPEEENTEIEQIPDIEADATPIEEEENLIPEADETDPDFENIPITEDYATDTDYAQMLQDMLDEYKYKPEEKDPYYDPNDIFRPADETMTLESEKISLLRGGVWTKGDITVVQDYYYFTAKDVSFMSGDKQNFASGEDLMYTTCSNHEHPHWSLKANKVQGLNYGKTIRLKLHNVHLKLGNFTIGWLPVWNYTINKKNAKSLAIIPLLTYNKGSGIGVKLKPKFEINNRLNIDTYFRYTVHDKFQYNVYANYAIDRDFGSNPYNHSISMSSMIKKVNDLGAFSPYEKGILRNEYKKRAHLTTEIGTLYRDKDTTMDDEDVTIYKPIDAYLKYSLDPIGNTKNLDLLSLIAPSVSFNYAREKDDPAIDEYVNKYNVKALLPFALGKFGGINFQPFVKYDYTNYKNYQSYTAYSAGLDLSQYYKDNSYWNVRYIYAKDHGDPLFDFDSVDYERGLMLSGVKNFGNKFMAGAWFAHNFNEHKSYRYGIMAGIKEDCMWASVGYDFKQKKFYGDLEILGF